MALHEADSANFDTLVRAIKNGNYCLAETRIAATGQYRATICAVNKTDDEVMLVPLAIMIWDNPFELLVSPEEIALDDMKKEAAADVTP